MHFLGKSITIIFYALLFIMVTVAIILQGTAIWLSSDAGEGWVKAQLEKSLKGAQYSVVLDNIDLEFIGVSLDSVYFKGDDGLKVKAEDVRLRLNPFPITYKQLGIYLAAQSVDVIGLPKSGDSKPQQLKRLDLPDIYFDKVGVSLDIEELTYADIVVALQINQSFVQNETREIDAIGVIDIDSRGRKWWPKSVTNKINITPEIVRFVALNISGEYYSVESKGQYHMPDKKIMLHSDGVLKGSNNAMTDESVVIKADLNGDVESISGPVDLQGSYNGFPLDAQTKLILSRELVSLHDMSATLSGMSLNGRAELYVEEKRLEAVLNDIQRQELNIDRVRINAQYPENGDLVLPLGKMQFDDIRYKGQELKSANIAMQYDKKFGYAFSLDGQGTKPMEIEFSGSGNVRALSPPNISITEFNVTTEDANLSMEGDITPDKINARIKASANNIAALPYISAPYLSHVALDEFKMRVSQSPSNPNIGGTFQVSAGKKANGYAAISGSIDYQNNAAQVTFRGDGKGIETLDGRLSTPISISLYPFAFTLQQNNNLDGKIAALFDLDDMNTVMPFQGIEYSGRLESEADLSGSLKDFSIDGRIAISDGMIRDRSGGLVLEKIETEAIFNRQAVTISSFKASGENGVGTIDGTARIGLSNLNSPDLGAEMTATNLKLLQSLPYDLRLNADILLSSPAEGYLVSGDLSLGELTIQLPEVAGTSIPKLNIVEKQQEQKPSLLDQMRIDLEFKAEDRIFIRGYGVDAELGGELTIDGTMAQPRVTGVLSAVRGRFEQFGRRFSLDRSDIRFTGEQPPAPHLDILAIAVVNDVETQVMLKGTPENPDIEFASVPSLPDDEILAMILFGEDISQISPLQALQLASTLRQLSGLGGGQGFDLIGGIRDATGLDDIRIDGAGENARLGVGKYISEDVYVNVSGGAGEESGAASIEVELTPFVTLESRVGQAGETESNIFWQWDY